MDNNTAPGTSRSSWQTWPVGQRMVVRTKLPTGSSHLYTDLLGTVVKTDDTGVILQTANGQVTVRGSEIALAKPIPLPPAPRRRRPPPEQ